MLGLNTGLRGSKNISSGLRPRATVVVRLAGDGGAPTGSNGVRSDSSLRAPIQASARPIIMSAERSPTKMTTTDDHQKQPQPKPTQRKKIEIVREPWLNDVLVQKLDKHFSNKFQKHQPEYYIRVPGRVNLIGEHVDYCGYSVFPMAINQCITVAVLRVKDKQPTLRLTNLCSERYKDISINISAISLKSLAESPCWSNYFLCGIRGAFEQISEKQLNEFKHVGFLFAVAGNIPESSGLSSSSALVTAAMLAVLVGYGVKISRLHLAQLSARCERYIGTAGGGMDQAITVNAKQGFAARIDFNPLTVKQFQLPSTVKFVVAQSLAVKNKAASNEFNTRVVECRLASQIIAKRLDLKWQDKTKLAALQKCTGNTLDQMIKLVHQHLHVKPYTKKEVCEILSVSENELNQLSLTPNTIDVQEFSLHQRALHVFQEARRTEKFCDVCENSGSAADLGWLMNDSHSSLRDLYQCSHPDLDELAKLCLRGGAYGCKLTGAGWGGCLVVMVPSAGANKFVEFIKEQFYAKRSTDGRNIDQLIFIASPSTGLRIYVNVEKDSNKKTAADKPAITRSIE